MAKVKVSISKLKIGSEFPTRKKQKNKSDAHVNGISKSETPSSDMSESHLNAP